MQLGYESQKMQKYIPLLYCKAKKVIFPVYRAIYFIKIDKTSAEMIILIKFNYFFTLKKKD